MASRPSNQSGSGGIDDAHVLAQQRGHGGGVAALVRVHVAPQELALLRRGLARRRPREAPGRRSLERRARPLQRAVGRGDARLEQRRRSRAPTSRARRAGSARPAGAAAAAGSPPGTPARSSRARRARRPAGSSLGGDALEQPVGVGLQPRHLGAARRGAAGSAPRAAAGAAALERVEAGVRGDAVEPGAERRARRAKRRALAPGAQERLLHQRPRRRRTSRACGSSAPAARAGGARQRALKAVSSRTSIIYVGRRGAAKIIARQAAGG